MSILSTVKKGYMTIKTASGYVKLLPRTLATLVAMSDGKSVEDKINELNGKLTDSLWITAPSTASTIKYRKKYGYVTVVGNSYAQLNLPVYGGTGSSGTKICTLPAEYRPSTEIITIGTLRSNDGYELQVVIWPDGIIELYNFGRAAAGYWGFTVTYPL